MASLGSKLLGLPRFGLKKALQISVYRNAATYEGEGKTTAKIMNKELELLMIDKISNVGFRLNNGVQLLGPSILFPRSVLCWNITNITDVNKECLSFFSVLNPRFSIMIIGYGSPQDNPNEATRKEIIMFGNEYGISMELLPTEAAVSTYNFLNYERRSVVGAFIPPKFIRLYDDSYFLMEKQREKALKVDFS